MAVYLLRPSIEENAALVQMGGVTDFSSTTIQSA